MDFTFLQQCGAITTCFVSAWKAENSCSFSLSSQQFFATEGDSLLPLPRQHTADLVIWCLRLFDMNERWSWRTEGLSCQGATKGAPFHFPIFPHYPPCKSWVVVIGKDFVNEHKLLLCLELPIIVTCHSCSPTLSLPELKNLAILLTFMVTAFSSHSLPNVHPIFPLRGLSLSLSLF